MGLEEIIEQLQSENAQLREQNAQVLAETELIKAKNAQLRQQVEELCKRVHELEGQVQINRKPPSSDGYAKKKREVRRQRRKERDV